MSRLRSIITTYQTGSIEVSPGSFFSQKDMVEKVFSFKNTDLAEDKLDTDGSYRYYFDIITPRVGAEVKNLRIDSKNILLFSNNPRLDFSPVFLANLALSEWLAESGHDLLLKDSVFQFVELGNVGFKRTGDGFCLVDALNLYVSNQMAETVEDTDLVERVQLTPVQMMSHDKWDREAVERALENHKGTSFSATDQSTEAENSSDVYELFEFTGVLSEAEYNEIKGIDGGDEHNYFIGKVIVSGLQQGEQTAPPEIVYCQEAKGKKMSDLYMFAHRGPYSGRFWRKGLIETLIDHQIRANEIANDIAQGLSWASKTIFRSRDKLILQNVRADLDNGAIIEAEDFTQVDVRMQSIDQLIADWNRLMVDADRLSNSVEIVRGEGMPAGTPFRLGALMDQNAGLLFVLYRQQLTLPYKRVFREWVLKDFVKDMTGKDIFRLSGDENQLQGFREVIVESWYVDNLVHIGPHTKEQAEELKQEKMDELAKSDPVIKNAKEVWDGVLPRMFVTITGENSDLQDQVQDLVNLVNFEQDPGRRNWILDSIYKIRGIPIPPAAPPQPQQQPQMDPGAVDMGGQDPNQLQPQPF